MAFNASAHAAQIGAEHRPFEFEWKASTYEVPSARMLSTGALRRIAALGAAANGDGDRVQQMFDALDQMWPGDALAALMEMPPETVMAVTEAWMDEAMGDEESGKSRSPLPRKNGSGRP